MMMENHIFPCMDINRSPTRKEELLVSTETLSRFLSQLLHPLSVGDLAKF